RSAEDGEVLGEDVHVATVHAAVTGDHAIAENLALRHVEVRAAVRDELVDLDEAVLVEKELNPLARGEFALFVLRLDAVGSASLFRFDITLLKKLDPLLDIHKRPIESSAYFDVNNGRSPGGIFRDKIASWGRRSESIWGR